ncbi:MAG: phospholipase [Acidimicrobiales bacterium]
MDAHPHGVSRAGTVVLDIGGDVGAAVVVVPTSLAGVEIEIRAEGGAWAEVHTAVRERELPGGGSLQAAVFESLPAGTYQVRVRHGEPGATTTSFTVSGGHVSDVSWPTL